MQGSHVGQVVVHQVGVLACEEVDLKPWEDQLDQVGGEERDLEVGVLAEGVGVLGVGRNLEVGGQEALVPLVAAQTDQGKEQGEGACPHDLEDHQGEEGGLGQVVGGQEDLEVQVDLEGGVGDPVTHLKLYNPSERMTRKKMKKI